MIYPKSLVLHPPFHTQIEVKKVIDCLKNVSKKKPILEFGAGTGRLTIPLLKAGFNVEIVEPDPKSVEILKTIIPKSTKIYTKIPNKKYAAIVGTDVLHHIDMPLYLPMFYQHLSSGGIICFSEPNALNPFWYVQPQMFLFWKLEKGLLQIQKDKIIGYLYRLGFKKVDIWGLGILPRPFFAFNKKLVGLTDKIGNIPILRKFAYRLLITAQN